jgi:glycosyltransferase involved in cell wall biosynthesis
MKVGTDGLDVGLLCTSWTPDRGGVLSHTEDLARALVARGHRVAVLCLDTRGGDSLAVEDERVPLHGGGEVQVRRVRYAYGDHAQLMDLMVHDRLRDVVLGWLAETPCDVVHVHHVTGFGGSAVRAIHDVGQPLVMTLHDYWMLDPRGQLFTPGVGALDPTDLESLARDLVATWPHLFEGGHDAHLEDVRAFRAEALACLALSDLLFTPSAAAREVFERAGVDSGRIDVVENGVDVEAITAAVGAARAERARAHVGEVRLGVLGSVLPSKGVAEAVNEAALDGLVLEIHGDLTGYHGHTGHLDRLRELAATAPDRVRLVGPFEREALPRVLAELDGVAVPSEWEEVFGLSAREARAAGLPVLVSDAGGLHDVVASGGGLVVPRGDRAAWIAALGRFMGAERATWSAAPCQVRTTDAMAEELLTRYADAIEQRTGERPVMAAEVQAEQASEASAPPARRGFLGRLFGGR